MKFDLTPQEQSDLLWEPGDSLEVISGNLSFTSRRQFQVDERSPLVTEVQFFFESSDPSWGTREWMMCMDADIPNGPALLVLYRRASTGCAWGVVSMVNRAWSHITPLDSMSLAKGTSKAKENNKAVGMGLLASFAVLFAMFICTGGLLLFCLPVLLVIPAFREWFERVTGYSKFRHRAQTAAGTARALMFRIMQNADRFWEGSGNTLSGRL